MAAYEVLLLNTAIPQIQAAQTGDTYVVPRDIAFSAALTLSAGTANGVPYLNGSKVLTTGSALTFDGTRLGVGSSANTEGMLTVGTGTVTDKNGIVLYRGAASSVSATQAAIFNELNGITTGESITLRSPTGFKFQNNDGSSEWMRLTSTGLGIGTSSPGAKLDVNGATTRFYSDGANVDVSINRQGNGIFNPTLTMWSAYSATNVSHQFTIDSSGPIQRFLGSLRFQDSSASNIERARITSGGEVLFGLTAQTNTPANGFVFQNLGTTSSQVLIGHSNGSGSGTYYEAYFYDSTVIGSVTQNGTTGVLYNITSDYRLKTVTGPVTNAGSRIDALEPVEYTWKANGSSARGFLAHKFQEVYPNSVTGQKDAIDAGGNPVYQNMQASTSEVIADLVAELQSLRARVAQLEQGA